MLLPTLEKRIRQPKVFEAEFEKFWRGIGAKISQEKSVAQVSRYDSLAVAAGVNTFFDQNPVAFDSNMNNFTPPQTEHLLITRLRFFEGVNAAINATVWGQGATTAVAQNAQITIINNGIRVFTRYSGVDFMQLTTRDSATIELEEPIAWIGQTDLEVQINIIGAPAANTNFRIEVIGIGYVA